ncbi:MAG: L,D-transpeptidase [Nocardioidaceae bacterium]
MSRIMTLISKTLVLLVAMALAVATVLLVVSDSDGRDRSTRERTPADRQLGNEPARAPADLRRLVAATTAASLPAAPADATPQATTDGLVVRPLRVLPLYDKPAGRAFAKMPPQQFGDTWLPVIGQRSGWVRVLLPSRPNGATGWLRESGVELRTSPYLVRVHLGSRTLEINYEGGSIGSWPVAVGSPDTPTPTGRTFLLGSVLDDAQSFSPIILPLGSHSDTLDTYGGGPGTVALHGWPEASVFGSAISHGCIRVPADALDRLTQVPLGTLVIVDNS